MDNNKCNLKWLKWAKELQFLAQVGLAYTKDDFDKERFERIRAIAAEMMSLQSGLPLEQVQGLFCNETGFQTPKLDTRAAIFADNKILLVKEKNGTWSMPGGWVDVMQTIKSNTVKEYGRKPDWTWKQCALSPCKTETDTTNLRMHIMYARFLYSATF